MKNKLIIGILIAAVIGVGYWISSDTLGRGSFANFDTLIGTSASYDSLPREAVFENNTTTDAGALPAGYIEGGAIITQNFNTDGYDWVQLAFSAKAGTATSSMYVRMQLYDGVDWSDINASSTPDLYDVSNSTSTVITLLPTGFKYTPGVATTSFMRYPFYVYGSKQGRFVMYADDLATDGVDGVQMWAKVIRINPFGGR